MPASFCGIVGLKPTWGLVPYTGAIGLDASIDHIGPMTSTVADCALLLQVIAGTDGLDDRQQKRTHDHGEVRYYDKLVGFLRDAPDEPLRGIRIGILAEGFGLEFSDPAVDEAVRDAAEKFRSLGAEVKPVSVPSHSTGQMIWGLATFAGSYQSAVGQAKGRKVVYMNERTVLSRVGQVEFDHGDVGARSMMLSGMFLETFLPSSLYGRCKNLLRKLSVRIAHASPYTAVSRSTKELI